MHRCTVSFVLSRELLSTTSVSYLSGGRLCLLNASSTIASLSDRLYVGMITLANLGVIRIAHHYFQSFLPVFILFDLHTGLRQDELLSLQGSRVDLFRKIIIQETKNGKPRTLPLNQIALKV